MPRHLVATSCHASRELPCLPSAHGAAFGANVTSCQASAAPSKVHLIFCMDECGRMAKGRAGGVLGLGRLRHRNNHACMTMHVRDKDEGTLLSELRLLPLGVGRINIELALVMKPVITNIRERGRRERGEKEGGKREGRASVFVRVAHISRV